MAQLLLKLKEGASGAAGILLSSMFLSTLCDNISSFSLLFYFFCPYKTILFMLKFLYGSS